MGKTTIIMVAVLAVTVGVYQVAINKVEISVVGSAETHSYRLQAEEIAKSGVHLAIQQLRSRSSTGALMSSSKEMDLFGGTVTFIADDFGLPANQLRITSQADYKGTRATVVVIVERTHVHQGNHDQERWQIVETLEVHVG